MFDQPFTVGAGRAADAVEFLIANSALKWLTEPTRGLYNELAVPAPPYVSRGEGMLWELAKDLGDAPASMPSLATVAAALDEQNRAAVVGALCLMFGYSLDAPWASA